MKHARASVLAMPNLVPYYGPTPRWVKPDRPMWITTSQGEFRSRDGIIVRVPKGYITDFASTPTIIWPILPPHGALVIASLPHDWGYSHGGKSGLLPKRWWDALFHDLIVITPDVPKWKRKVAYPAVKLFGQGGWQRGWCSFEPGTVPDWPTLGQEVKNGR